MPPACKKICVQKLPLFGLFLFYVRKLQAVALAAVSNLVLNLEEEGENECHHAKAGEDEHGG